MITHTPQYISAKPLHFLLQMLKFEDVVKLQTTGTKLLHRCINKIVPMHYFNLVKVDHTHNHNTKHAFHCFIQILSSIMSQQNWVTKKRFFLLGQKYGVKFLGTLHSVLCGTYKFKRTLKVFRKSILVH